MSSERLEIKLRTQKNLSQARAHYQDIGWVQIDDLLLPDCARHIHQHLRDQKQWNLVWNNNGKHVDMDYLGVDQWSHAEKQKLLDIIHQQAENEFQYYFAAIPIFDIYQQNRLPGHFFNQLCEFVNSPAFLALARAVTGDDRIRFADIQATRYSRGHFLTEHDDAVGGKNRVAAYVINLTPRWKVDWGGALIFPDRDSGASALFPKFNVLNVFSVPQKHAVTVVSSFAVESRYSLTGWFRY